MESLEPPEPPELTVERVETTPSDVGGRPSLLAALLIGESFLIVILGAAALFTAFNIPVWCNG